MKADNTGPVQDSGQAFPRVRINDDTSIDTAGEDREQSRDLLTAMAGGDRVAFETLYRRTSATLFGICPRLLYDRTQAEEALQDVYLAIWRKAGTYDGDRASAITWLAQIMRNRAIDYLRASKSDRLSQPLDLSAEPVDEDLRAPELVEALDDSRCLPARSRSVSTLPGVHG